MSQMVDLAAKTPFDLQGVASGARQLLAYGFAAEDITDTLTRLGNVAAGTGITIGAPHLFVRHDRRTRTGVCTGYAPVHGLWYSYAAGDGKNVRQDHRRDQCDGFGR